VYDGGLFRVHEVLARAVETRRGSCELRYWCPLRWLLRPATGYYRQGERASGGRSGGPVPTDPVEITRAAEPAQEVTAM